MNDTGSWTMKTCTMLLPLLLSAGCGGDEDRVPPSEAPDETHEVRELRLAGLPPETPAAGLFAPQTALLRDAIARIEAAGRDEEAKGVFLRIAPFGGGFGRADELAAAVNRVREKGKPVHCHFEQLDNVAYLFATRSCDRLTMTPAGDLNFVGLAAQLYFAKALLDRIGVKADLLQVGRFKGAADALTEESLPEATAESLNLLLDDLQKALLEGTADGRTQTAEQLANIVDRGPFSSGRAMSLGLIDAVGFLDGARQKMREAAEVERVRRVPLRTDESPESLLELLTALAGEPKKELPPGKRLAVATLAGTIIDGEQNVSGSTASGPFVRAMKRFRDDEDVSAVVLRIHSPGGSALASDRMWHAVRQLALKKPVLVSVADIAASGGYYVASAADKILAPEGAIVGSIGVVGGKIAVGELAERSGIHLQVLRRGAHSAWTSPASPFSDSERQVLRRAMQGTYDRFLRRIETGRGLDSAALAPLAEGRIWSGKRAVENGLVDEVGTLFEAMRQARELGKIDENAPIETWPSEMSPLDALAEAFGEGTEDQARKLAFDLASSLIPFSEGALTAPMMLTEERTLIFTPFVLHIQ